MPREVTVPELCAVLANRPADTARRIVAVAGPPAAGKTTLAADLGAALNDRAVGTAAVLGMDGFHYDDRVLKARGDLSRKGAPHTFDVDGFAAMLRRLRDAEGREVAIPVFDREIEIARSAAAIVGPDVRTLIVEGNYLLLDRSPWRDLLPLYDVTVMVDGSEAMLRKRLAMRWRHLRQDQRLLKLEANDLPNGRLIRGHSVAADFILQSDARL